MAKAKEVGKGGKVSSKELRHQCCLPTGEALCPTDRRREVFKNGMEVPALLGIGPLSVKPLYVVSCDLGAEGSAAEGNIPKDLIKNGASGCEFGSRIRQVIL